MEGQQVFPGQYTKDSDPRVVVTVTKVESGTVFLRGVGKSPLNGARMDTHTFMTSYSK